MLRWFAVLMAGIGLAAAGACANKGPDEPALAEVHSPRLRSHMGELGTIAISDLADATRGPTVRRDLQRIARDLQGIAAMLPDLVHSLDLEADDRARFVTFADSLGGSAARLGTAAASAPGPVVEARIEEVTNTCAGCHWAFRTGPGTE